VVINWSSCPEVLGRLLEKTLLCVATRGELDSTALGCPCLDDRDNTSRVLNRRVCISGFIAARDVSLTVILTPNSPSPSANPVSEPTTANEN
jgi:hypothetical protein